MDWVWRDCGENVDGRMSGQNTDEAYWLASAIAWVIAKIKNRMPADLSVGPAKLLSGQKGGPAEWRYLFPISLVNTGNKPINTYSVFVSVPAYLLKAGDDGKYKLVVDKPGKELQPGKSVLIAQLELCLSKEIMARHKDSIKRDYICCTYEIEGFTARERRLYLSNHN